MNASRLLDDEEVIALLDAKHPGWKRDCEGWVTLERAGIMWRVHYYRGELVEVGWWGDPRTRSKRPKSHPQPRRHEPPSAA